MRQPTTHNRMTNGSVFNAVSHSHDETARYRRAPVALWWFNIRTDRRRFRYRRASAVLVAKKQSPWAPATHLCGDRLNCPMEC